MVTSDQNHEVTSQRSRRRSPLMPRVTSMTKSQVTMELRADCTLLDQTIEDHQTTMRLSARMAQSVAALFLTTGLCQEGIVHMVHGWRCEDKAVRCVMDSGCVAPPGMRPTYLITKKRVTLSSRVWVTHRWYHSNLGYWLSWIRAGVAVQR